jgi:tmRNA-binding protein
MKIIPLAVLLKENKLVKIEIGIGKKKKLWDKRREIIEKEMRRKERELRRL